MKVMLKNLNKSVPHNIQISVVVVNNQRWCFQIKQFECNYFEKKKYSFLFNHCRNKRKSYYQKML